MLAEGAGASAAVAGAFPDAVTAGDGSAATRAASSEAIGSVGLGSVVLGSVAFGLASSAVAIMASAGCAGAMSAVLAVADGGGAIGAGDQSCGICGLVSALISGGTSDLAVSVDAAGLGASAWIPAGSGDGVPG